MHSLRPVTGRLAAEIMATHCTREAAAARNPDHINKLDGIEEGRRELLPDAQTVGFVSSAEFPEPPRGLATSFGNSRFSRPTSLTTPIKCRNMTTTSTAGFGPGQLPKTDLNGTVAIPADRANLRHDAGTSLNNGDRHDDAISIIHLSHTDFSTNESDRHNKHPRKKRKRNKAGRAMSRQEHSNRQPHTLHPTSTDQQERATNPEHHRTQHSGCGSRLDFNIHSSWQGQFIQSIHSLSRGLNDVNEPFVGANFELFARLFVNVRTAEHCVALDPGRQRHRPMNDCTCALCRIDNFGGRLIQHRVVVCLHPDPDAFFA
ncbi:MAG: hypothetical protein RLZZ436_4448 [Planctomycetota bacterium]